jgi:hypothetical protein
MSKTDAIVTIRWHGDREGSLEDFQRKLGGYLEDLDPIFKMLANEFGLEYQCFVVETPEEYEERKVWSPERFEGLFDKAMLSGGRTYEGGEEDSK